MRALLAGPTYVGTRWRVNCPVSEGARASILKVFAQNFGCQSCLYFTHVHISPSAADYCAVVMARASLVLGLGLLILILMLTVCSSTGMHV